MKQYRLSYYVETDSYIFHYNTSSDILYISKTKENAYEYNNLAEPVEGDETLKKREMIKRTISGKYKRI